MECEQVEDLIGMTQDEIKLSNAPNALSTNELEKRVAALGSTSNVTTSCSEDELRLRLNRLFPPHPIKPSPAPLHPELDEQSQVEELIRQTVELSRLEALESAQQNFMEGMVPTNRARQHVIYSESSSSDDSSTYSSSLSDTL
eukprot:TRINITY_DN1484_c0_g1_i3.p1 TRINITY_DN1484_c0_g1~~TRINITY_DN1484_c0_g1_i3.p1  ORF type:complete len:143 (-),score=25.20 TRINITY_DN1484_c0_g1_i3:119-547(-)